jgi:hypothetical protein
MKTKSLIVPFMAVLLAFAVSGCYAHRPYDPYYDTTYRKEYKHKHKHRHYRDYDRDRDHDRDSRY